MPVGARVVVIHLLREPQELAETPLIVQKNRSTRRDRVKFPEMSRLFFARLSIVAADMLLNLTLSPGMKIHSFCCEL